MRRPILRTGWLVLLLLLYAQVSITHTARIAALTQETGSPLATEHVAGFMAPVPATDMVVLSNIPASDRGMPHELGHAAIHVVPYSNGESVLVAAERLDGLSAPAHAQLLVGDTSHDPGHSDCNLQTGMCEYIFEEVMLPGTSSPLSTIMITTTGTPTQPVILGTSDFIRHYVPGDQTVELASLDNNVGLLIPSGALPDESYVVIMNTFAPPADPPAGHRLLGQSYSIRVSGAITQSLAPLLLRLNYDELLLGDIDPHTLSIFRWDDGLHRWFNLVSDPFGDEPAHTKSISEFGTFALMASTTWRDPFQDYSGTAQQQNVRLAYGGRLALRSSATVGFATSKPITPVTTIGAWGTVTFASDVPNGTTLTVDILDAAGTTTLLANVPTGASLADIDPVTYPSLRLRVNLNSQQAGLTPYLDEWSLSWTVATAEPRMYMPLAPVRQGSSHVPTSAPTPIVNADDWPLATLSAMANHSNNFDCGPPPTPPITWATPVRLTQGNNISIAPDLAVDHQNRLHAVWYDGSRIVRYATKETGASAWSAPVALSTANDAYYPAIGVAPQGAVHVIWRENNNIKYTMRPPTGAWLAPIAISSSGTVNIMPDLYADAMGDIHVVWSDGSPGNNEIFYRVRHGGSNVWSDIERVSNTAGSSWAPTVAADGLGGVHIAWYDYTPGVTEIYYATKPPGVATWSAATNVSMTAGGSQWPTLAVDAGNTVHLVWQDTLTLGGQTQAHILYYISKAAGGAWSSSAEITRGQANGQNAQPPTLAVGSDGSLHVAWATMTDYRLNHAFKPDAQAGWSTPQLVASLASPPNPANQWYFSALAGDQARGMHLLWNDMAGSGTFNQDIKYSSALPPPIPANHVLVRDDSGHAVSGACIFQNGQLVGTTNDLGIFAPGQLNVGDTLVALQPMHDQPSLRGHDWVFRTALTSLSLDADAPNTPVSGHRVAQLGRQSLTLHRDLPLVYFNLVISIQWNATDAYLQEINRAVRRASNYLFDVTDGQMAFGQVAVYDNGAHWEDADIQILTRNNVRPHAYVGGVLSTDLSQVMRVGRHWDRRSGAQGSWDLTPGYRTLIHEFGHYALHLFDSYYEYTYDENNNLTGVNTGTGCTELDFTFSDETISATIMDYQYATTELAARNVPGLWEANTCVHTVQWQLNEESDWETVLRHYRDTVNPPGWQFTSPMSRTHVLAGPVALPPLILPFPEVEIHNHTPDAPVRTLTVLRTDGQRYAEGALVAVDVIRDGRTVTLDQGLTARTPITATGTITLYGALPGSHLRVVSINGGLSAQTTITTALNYTLTLRTRGLRHPGQVLPNPYAMLWPSSLGDDLTIHVGGVEQGGFFSALVVAPGGLGQQTIFLQYSTDTQAYVGTVNFASGGPGLGWLGITGSLQGDTPTVDTQFTLARVNVNAPQDLYTPDGAAWLHVDPDSFSSDNVFMALMPTGSVPAPLPAGWSAVGNAYSLLASGSQTDTTRPTVLRLFYDPAHLPTGIDPAALRMGRFIQGEGWRLLTGELDAERRALALETSHLGIYALFAPTGLTQGTPRAFMPQVRRGR